MLKQVQVLQNHQILKLSYKPINYQESENNESHDEWYEEDRAGNQWSDQNKFKGKF